LGVGSRELLVIVQGKRAHNESMTQGEAERKDLRSTRRGKGA
jgi:hypothetical protein